MKFGSLCRKKRIGMNLSVHAISERAKLDVLAITKIENGKRQPNIGQVVGLIRALKITPDELDELYGGLWPRQEQERETSEDKRQTIPWYRREDS